jgi:hypothetical protein
MKEIKKSVLLSRHYVTDNIPVPKPVTYTIPTVSQILAFLIIRFGRKIFEMYAGLPLHIKEELSGIFDDLPDRVSGEPFSVDVNCIIGSYEQFHGFLLIASRSTHGERLHACLKQIILVNELSIDKFRDDVLAGAKGKDLRKLTSLIREQKEPVQFLSKIIDGAFVIRGVYIYSSNNNILAFCLSDGIYLRFNMHIRNLTFLVRCRDYETLVKFFRHQLPKIKKLSHERWISNFVKKITKMNISKSFEGY